MGIVDRRDAADGRAGHTPVWRGWSRRQRGGVERDARMHQRCRRVGTNADRMQAGVRDPVHEATDRRNENGADQHGDAQGPEAVHA